MRQWKTICLLAVLVLGWRRTAGATARLLLPPTLSTNWAAQVEAVLPPRALRRGELTFQRTTNLLCRESRHGNRAALELWGLAEVGDSHTPEQLQAGIQMLKSSAGKGYVPAMLNLGDLYETGRYVTTNYDEAFHWFGLAADHGSAQGELELGGCYHYGLGTIPDLPMAARCYRLAAGQTNYAAMKSYGDLLINGLGVPRDLDAAEYWFTRAAMEGGNRRAMYDLGVLYAMKAPDSNAMAEAVHWYREGADRGDALACDALANCYATGWGVRTNQASYRHWLFKAATLGDTDAQYRMGAAYRTGDGVPQDTETSLEWYRKAASKNHPEAYYDLALHYLRETTNRLSLQLGEYYMCQAARAGNREAQFQCALSLFRGDVMPRNFKEGQEWLLKSANNGWARAQFALFQLYFYGIPPGPGCPAYPKDQAQAVNWLREAATNGDLRAQSTLALMLIQGKDMDENTLEAEQLLRSAAERGYAQAQDDLGFAILHGDLGSTDWVDAAMWCELAEEHATDARTRERAEENLSNAMDRLTPDQQAEVERRVKEFKPIPIVQTDPLMPDWETNSDYQQEDGRFGH